MSSSKFKDLKKYFEKFTDEEIQAINQRDWNDSKLEFESFAESFEKGLCYICKEPLNSFNDEKFCFHWFLYPDGIKKKNFTKKLKEPISFFGLQSYLRWCANTGEKFININDLSIKRTIDKLYEFTIKYEQIEWSFSVSESDLNGHPNTKHGAIPHYHMQMTLDSKPFICFGDYHIKFTDEDLFNIESMKQMGNKYVIRNTFGNGMSFFEKEENLEKIQLSMKKAKSQNESMFHVQTFIESLDESGISNDLMKRALEESEKTGKPIARVVKEMNINARIICLYSPSKNVPEIKSRAGGRK